MRFPLLETLREYGHEQLVPEERAAAERRHVDFFVALAEDAKSRNDQSQNDHSREGIRHNLDARETEHDSLRAALGYCREETGTQNGLRLVAAMAWFWG